MQIPILAVESFSMKATSDSAVERLLGITSSDDVDANLLGQFAQLLDASSRGVAPIDPFRRRLLHIGYAEMDDKMAIRDCLRNRQRRLSFMQRAPPPLVVSARVGERLPPLAVDEARADRRVHGVQP